MKTFEKNLHTQVCYHCGETCQNNIQKDEHHFCCRGCLSVYEILSQNTLCDYYQLEKSPGNKPVTEKSYWDYLDIPEVIAELIQYQKGTETHVIFQIPGMHCMSCLWLLENLHKIHPGVVHSKVNFNQKTLYIIFDQQQTNIKELVKSLYQIGYEPSLSFSNLDQNKKIQKDNKSRIYKIGLAGFCFSNIMMLSFPSYLGLDKINDALIHSYTLIYAYILVMPILFYAANEFFINAWKSFKYRWINIDLPIAIAISVSFGRSVYETLTAREIGYLDSLSGIVFFMLVGRYLQEKITASVVFDRDFKSFIPIAVNKFDGKSFTPTLVSKLNKNDIIRVFDQEICPVDGYLLSQRAQVDYSFVTGESASVPFGKNEKIFAGGKSVGGAMELKVIADMSESYLNHLWSRFSPDTKKWDHKWVDVLSQRFTIFIFAITLIAGIYWFWQGNTSTMWNVITTTLIVICPCTLLLASSFTYGQLIKLFARKGLHLKDAQVIDRLAQVDHIIFDKTGTLTETNPMRIQYEGRLLNENEKIMLKSLLDQSGHPFSKLISRTISTDRKMDIDSFQEVKGEGIEGWINDHYIKIGSAKFTGAGNLYNEHTGSKVYVCIDRKILACFIIEQKYRSGIKELLERLKSSYKLALLSGDNDSEKNRLIHWFGHVPLLFHQKPDDKIAFIKNLKEEKNGKALMVGDGLNDAGAFKESHCGLAIIDHQHHFTPASDGILEANSFIKLDGLLKLAKKAKLVIFSAFGVSGIYNIVGLYFALQGMLSPIIAAIIMPLSSLSIIGLSYFMTKYFVNRYGLDDDKSHPVI